MVASIGFEASKFDYFHPFLGIRGNELSELFWRHRHWNGSQVDEL